MATFLKIFSAIVSAIGPFFDWLKQKQDPEVKRKNRLLAINDEIKDLVSQRHFLIEKQKNEKNPSKRDEIGGSIVDTDDAIAVLRLEKEKLVA